MQNIGQRTVQTKRQLVISIYVGYKYYYQFKYYSRKQIDETLISKILLSLQVGSTTMLQYFVDLAQDISSIAKERILNILKQKFQIPRPILKVPLIYKSFIQLPKNVVNGSKSLLLQRVNSFIKKKNILSFSFVRHPFER